MRWLELPFETLASGVDEPELEAQLRGTKPATIASRLAAAKGEAAARIRADATIVAADTVVALDGQLLGKPVDDTDARRTLHKIQGRRHDVVTAVEVRCGGRRLAIRLAARVTMRAVPEGRLQEYVETGEPMDKAGAYAVQGRGGALVEEVHGCYLTVVGFPLCAVAALLSEAGITAVLDPVGLCREAAADLVGRSRTDYQAIYEVSTHPALQRIHIAALPSDGSVT